MNKLVETSQLKTTYWKDVVEHGGAIPSVYYDKQLDVLSFLIADTQKERIIIHYLDELVSLMYRHSDKEIVGIRIETFGKNFLPKYAELQKVWCLRDTGIEIENFSDLQIQARTRLLPVVKEIYNAADPIVEKTGIKLTPVPA